MRSDMAAEQRLYVSFDSEDNSGSKGGSGWIEEFTTVLNIFLTRLNGLSPDIILLDSKTKAPASLDQAEGLIVVVSKAYLKNKGFRRDLPLLTDKSKVFKIDLDPISKRDMPIELLGMNEFHFFGPSKKKDEDFTRLDGKHNGQFFWLKIVDLSLEILRLLYHKNLSGNQESPGTIFLAETSIDQVGNRDEVKRELLRHGYHVIPTSPLSGDLKQLEKEVGDNLQQADLTVQIIGEQYGEVANGTDKSIIEIQNELATRYYSENLSESEHSLHRLIWMPMQLKPSSDQQKLYLDRMRDDISATAGAEIIQTPLEVLKTVIHTRLQLFNQEKLKRSQIVKEKSGHKAIYLLFDQKDAGDIDGLIQEVKKKGIEVILPDFSGKQLELLRKHRDNLIKSDGVLVFANKNLNWVNSKLNDVIKAPGFGKSLPFAAKAILIKNSSIPKDKITNYGDLIMLNGNDKDHSKVDLGPFIDKISK
ncbi:MAG: hypothetical protein RIE58_06805 [Vicingaceae bacterium]